MIEKNDILYFFIVVIIAAALASAWAGMNHEPVPLQVQENRFPVVTFTPAPAPPPAMPTYDPQLVPGSYADTHRNSTDNGDFSPAPAPVVVTTMPLPTITEVPTTAIPVPTTTCCNNAFNASMTGVTGTIKSGFSLLGIAMIMMGIIGVISFLTGTFRMSPTRVFNTALDNAVYSIAGDNEVASQAIISGIMMIIIGGAIFIMGSVMLNAIAAAQPAMITCVPC